MKAIFRWCALATGLVVGSGGWVMASTTAPASSSPVTFETHRVAEASSPNTKAADSFEEDHGIGRWYAGLQVGAVIAPDMDIRGPNLTIDVAYDTGYIFAAVLGFKFPFSLRLDAEFSYRNNDTQSIYYPLAKLRLGDGVGATEALTATMNAWYDLDFLSGAGAPLGNWSPYFGGGLGYTNVDILAGREGNPNVLESSDSTIVMQFGAGFIYNYTPDLQVSLDYRYLRSILDLEFEDSRYADTNDAVYQTHSIMLGFRGFF